MTVQYRHRKARSRCHGLLQGPSNLQTDLIPERTQRLARITRCRTLYIRCFSAGVEHKHNTLVFTHALEYYTSLHEYRRSAGQRTGFRS